MSENKYINEWRNHVLQAAAALKEDDRNRYEKEIELMNEAYEAYKKDNDLSYATETSFGVAREIFESALPTLFTKNKNVVKKVLKTIREDKNLLSQFMFFESLKKYKSEYDPKTYMEEVYNLTQEKLDLKTIKESNKKLFNLLKENNIKPSDYIDEDKLNFYNDCNFILTEKRTLSNIDKFSDTVKRVRNVMVENAKDRESQPVKKTSSIEEFAEKWNSSLTESEKEILNVLLDTSKESKRKELFENYKKNCLKKIKSCLNEAEGDKKERLETLYSKVSSKTYDKDTIFEEMLKIIEVYNIFQD